MKDQSKIVHDINSSISSVSQSIDLLIENWKDNPELVEKMLPLTKEKMAQLKEDWKNLKSDFLK